MVLAQVSKEVAAQKVKKIKLEQRKAVLNSFKRKEQLYAQQNPKAYAEQQKKKKIVEEQQRRAVQIMAAKKGAFTQKKQIRSATFLDEQKRKKAALAGKVYTP